MQEIQVWSLGQEDPLEEEMAPHSSIAWKTRWTEEPSGSQSRTQLSNWVYIHFGVLDSPITEAHVCPLPLLLSSFAVTHSVEYDRLILLGFWDGVGE